MTLGLCTDFAGDAFTKKSKLAWTFFQNESMGDTPGSWPDFHVSSKALVYTHYAVIMIFLPIIAMPEPGYILTLLFSYGQSVSCLSQALEAYGGISFFLFITIF